MAFSVAMQRPKIRAVGIDTSCYTTSIAITEGPDILRDLRRPIKVPAGDVGLRQSDILFQHTQNLTQMMESIKGSFAFDSISVVGYSSAPRTQENSYMPVFLAGQNCATILSVALDCPMLAFSHQDGHMAAVQAGQPLLDRFVAFHLSGGTTEVVSADRNAHFGYNATVIGGTLDISFGQLIDRFGVYSGLPFPAGQSMDALALESTLKKDFIPINPRIERGFFNLSGYENKLKHLYDQKGKDPKDIYKSLLIGVANTLVRLMSGLPTNTEQVFIVGGVSASAVVRQAILEANFPLKRCVKFGSPALSTDNAAGIAFLASEAYLKGGF